MHRASLRVIIRVPEGGEANKSEGGAIVGVWIHTSGWSIDPEAPEMRCSGERSFWSGALAGRRVAVPESPGSRGATLRARGPCFRAAGTLFRRMRFASSCETVYRRNGNDTRVLPFRTSFVQ